MNRRDRAYPHIRETASPESRIVETASPQLLSGSVPESSVAYRELLRDLTAALTPLQMLHRQAIEALAPSVREILENGSRDTRLIEYTLDHLLDHACIPQGLATFKSVCRHYWPINPQATASYISAYREMWDSEPQSHREAGLE